MTLLTAPPYLQYMLYASLIPVAPREDVTYAIISEFLFQHKNPSDRFVIYPQISLRWKPDKPDDDREEVPDFGIGNFIHQTPFFKLRIGAEAKRSLDIVRGLPSPNVIEDDVVVMRSFHKLYFQGEDQAKAAVKGKHTVDDDIVRWLLFIGPYWASANYGPFTPEQLGVRTHKPSGSADYVEAKKAKSRLQGQSIRLHL